MARDTGFAWASGLAVGAAAMYFFDPRSGKRRRARARDKAVHAAHVAGESMERIAEDFGNRAQGTVARTRRLVHHEPVEDRVLEERLRSALGRVCSHPGAVKIEVEEGMVALRGPILDYEVKQVLGGLRRVPGVKHLESLLDPVSEDDAAHVPSLQGGRPRQGMPPDLLQRNMSPSGRAIVGIASGALILAGLRQGGLLGSLGAAMGGMLLVRAATNVEPGALLGTGDRHAVTVQKTIAVMAPVGEVFAYWSSFRNFPEFMQHVREIREAEEGKSHWVVDGPAGMPVSWDAEITALKPYRRIAWRSISGSTVRHAGEVRFEEVDENHTRLQVRMSYTPPAGLVGHAVASFFGADPRTQLDEDLVRFKSLLEDGSTSAHGEEIARQDVQPDTPVGER